MEHTVVIGTDGAATKLYSITEEFIQCLSACRVKVVAARARPYCFNLLTALPLRRYLLE